MGWRYGALGAVLVGALSAAACASIVGADFNGLGPEADAAATGGTAGAGGGGSGVGGTGATAGSGGSSASGGTSGTGGSAGATGGTAGSGGTAATGGTGGTGAIGGTGGTAATGGTGGTGGTSGTGGTGGTSGTGGTGGTSGTGGTGGASGTGGTGGTGGTDAGGPLVVINEVRALGGTDYVELKNIGAGNADLGGWGVTDAQGVNGAPNYNTALYFPKGTTLAPGKYLLVLAQQTSTGGPQTSCLGYTSTCWWATFGISGSGERVYLIDSHNSYDSFVDYPTNTVDGQTWGRLPDGTGNFALNLPTPGAKNQKYP